MYRRSFLRGSLAGATAFLASRPAALIASPELEGVACRSVHLGYPAPVGDAFHNEVQVAESHPGTYFCVCGFQHGYFGIQELDRGKKVVIFSVWDPGNQNDPNVVPEDQRVRRVFLGEGVRTGRFGNEGTGGQSFYDLAWKEQASYRFCVLARRVEDGKRTQFAAFLRTPEQDTWKPLVGFERVTKNELLSGYYAFIEDFQRDRVSATKTRTATFGNGWVRDEQGQWQALGKARFTGDGNPVMNINSRLVDGRRFLLSTGGDIRNDGNPLGETMSLEETGTAPQDLPDWNDVPA
jgi:hypothetical protein